MVVAREKINVYIDSQTYLHMNQQPQPQAAQTDLLSDVVVDFEYASRGQRFLNFLIDYILLIVGPGVLLGVVLASVGRDDILADDSSQTNMAMYFFFALVYVAYYTLCEFFFKGRTLGKLITGTKAVRADNQPLTFSNALLRSLSRLVPFEVLSGFGTPWHDSWTDTTVVKTR